MTTFNKSLFRHAYDWLRLKK